MLNQSPGYPQFGGVDRPCPIIMNSWPTGEGLTEYSFTANDSISHFQRHLRHQQINNPLLLRFQHGYQNKHTYPDFPAKISHSVIELRHNI